jgi:hypothetical protein
VATLWWFATVNKELAKHEEVKREYEAMEKRKESIEREYTALTGTKIRDSYADTEIYQAFEPLLKKRFKNRASSILA